MKPTAILKLNGTIAHDPAKYAKRAAEPVPDGELGSPPRHLTDAQKKIWKEIAATVAPGVLTIQDRVSMEVLSTLVSELRAGTLTTQRLGILMSTLSRLGLTPVDRAKVSVAPKKTEDSPFAQFKKTA
jgi:phage terminase small subunit